MIAGRDTQHSPNRVETLPTGFRYRTGFALGRVLMLANRATWHVGQRVSRKNTQELGTVVENNGSIKVNWDAGRTSYFRHSEAANVKLKGFRLKSKAASAGCADKFACGRDHVKLCG